MSAAATHVQWLTATPLWGKAGAEGPGMRRPAILGFGSTSFMDELATVLEDEPRRLASLVPAPPRGEDSPKLHLAVHGSFSLVAASLVCRMPGLPDHLLDAAAREQAGFVLRRCDQSGRELAWSSAAAGPGRRSWRRRPLGREATLGSGEEILPLFPVHFQLGERRRRLLAGLVPTFSGERSTDGSPKLDPSSLYALRCVYRRPQCGPLRPDLLSDRSTRFRIASFDDTGQPGVG